MTISLAAAKAAGRKWETSCASALDLFFPGTERRRQRGAKDAGDLVPGKGLQDWTIECKAERRIQLAEYLNEVEIERKMAHTRWGVVLIKRRQKATNEGYAVMPIWTWVQLNNELNYLRLSAKSDSTVA